MASLMRVVVTLGLLCTATQAIEGNQESKPSPADYKLSSSIKSLMQMHCNTTGHRTIIDCSFKLKTINGAEKNCVFEVPVPKHDAKFYAFDAPQLKAMLGGSKAVFQWSFRYTLDAKHTKHPWIGIVDVNDCGTVYVDFRLDSLHESNFHCQFYDTCFKVSLNSKEKCGERRNPCTLRFNYKGEQVEGAVDFPAKYYETRHSMVVDPHNSSSGSFFVNFKNLGNQSALANVSHVNHDGSESVLIENHFVENAVVTTAAVQSNENGYFSLCYPMSLESWEETHCIQSDVSGDRQMNATVSFAKDDTVLAVFNRRQGGLLIVNINCSTPIYNCTDSRVRVKEVAVDGEVVRDTVLNGLELDGLVVEHKKFRMKHLEMETEDCFYFAYVQHHSKTVFNYVKKCVDKMPPADKGLFQGIEEINTFMF